MHDGCSGSFGDGKMVVDKVRAMGFSSQFMPVPLKMTCSACSTGFEMEHFEERCPACGMVFGVTPCHSHDPEAVQAAGVGY